MDTPALPLFDAIRGVMAGSWPNDEYDLAESPLSYVDYREQKPECGELVTVTVPSIVQPESKTGPAAVVKLRPESKLEPEPEAEVESVSGLGPETPEADIGTKTVDYVDAGTQTDGSWLKAVLGIEARKEKAMSTSTLQSEREEDEDGTVVGIEFGDNLPTCSRRNTLVQTEGATDLDLYRAHSNSADSEETLSINSEGPAEVSTAVQVRIFSSPPPSSVTTLSLDRHDSGFFPSPSSRPQTPPSKANPKSSLPPSPPPSPPSMRRQAVVVGQSLIERNSTDSTASTTSTRIISIERPQQSSLSLATQNLSTTSARPRFSTSSLVAPNSLYSSPKSSRFFEDLSDEVRPGTAVSLEELARQSEPKTSPRPYTAVPSMQSEKVSASIARPQTAPASSSKGKPGKLKFKLPKGCGLKFRMPKWARKSFPEKKRVVSYESKSSTLTSGKA